MNRRIATIISAFVWLVAVQAVAFWYCRLLAIEHSATTAVLVAMASVWLFATAFFFSRLWVRALLTALLTTALGWALVNFAYFKIFGVFLSPFSTRLKSVNASMLRLVSGYAATVPALLIAAAVGLVALFFLAAWLSRRPRVRSEHDQLEDAFTGRRAADVSFRARHHKLSLIAGLAGQLCAIAIVFDYVKPTTANEMIAQGLAAATNIPTVSLATAKANTAMISDDLDILAGKMTLKPAVPKPVPPAVPHVIFYQMESVDSWPLDEDPNPMPFLSSLMARYGAPQNYFASGCTTVDSEFAALCGFLPETYGPVSDLYSKNSYNCLPSILKDKGYGTYLYHANDPSFWARDALGPAWGFENMVFDPELAYHQPDRLTFDRVVADLEANADRPTFQYVIGITAHAPHDEAALALYNKNFGLKLTPYPGTLSATAASMEADEKTERDYLALLKATDDDIRHLFSELENRGLAQSTTVLIYGDHRYYQSDSGDAEQDFFAYNRIPLAIVAPGADKSFWPAIATNLDLAPTVFDYLTGGTETLPDTFLGTSLYSTEHRDLMANKCLGRISSYDGKTFAELNLPKQSFRLWPFVGTLSEEAANVIKNALSELAITSDLMLARNAVGKNFADNISSASENKFTDTDGDGLSDLREKALGTDRKNPDTDGDGFTDGDEVANGFDPLGPGKKMLE